MLLAILPDVLKTGRDLYPMPHVVLQCRRLHTTGPRLSGWHLSPSHPCAGMVPCRENVLGAQTHQSRCMSSRFRERASSYASRAEGLPQCAPLGR